MRRSAPQPMFGQGQKLRLPLGPRLLLAGGGAAVRAVVNFLHWSSKVEFIGWERVEEAIARGRPFVFASWHSSITAVLLARFDRPMPRMVTMVSRSRDGEIAAALVRAFAAEVVRGSSSRGGAIGLRQFMNYLSGEDANGIPRAGFHLVDGPRGPRHRVKPGVIALAEKSGALIFPLSIGVARRWVAHSWDRHRVPLPFGRCVFVIGPPIDLGLNTGQEAYTAEDLQTTLSNLAGSHPLCARDASIS